MLGMYRPAFVFALLLVAAGTAAGETFQPQCELPFTNIKGKDAIADCPAQGSATKPDQQALNRAKNNFWATGTSVVLKFQDFKKLQATAAAKEIPFGSHNKIPDDRSVLKNLIRGPGQRRIGEGTVVQYVAFLSHPRYSNRSKGEAVNCKRGGVANNDIHIDLLRSPMEPACRSITAEISPHFRPDAWEVTILNLPQFVDRPMRFTGQLFFDASHQPCHNDSDKINPKRASIWEIHPVYAIDVCKFKTLARCSARKKSAWTPLADLVNTENNNDQ